MGHYDLSYMAKTKCRERGEEKYIYATEDNERLTVRDFRLATQKIEN